MLRAIGQVAEGLLADMELLAHVGQRMSYRHGFLSDETISRIRKKLRKKSIFHGPVKTRMPAKADVAERQRARVMIARLKKQGLVRQEKIGGVMRLFLTQAGKRKRDESEAAALPDTSRYPRTEGGAIVLVIFDIPEKDSRKRLWLRNALMAMGFSLVQKSVWSGKVVVPEDFVADIGELGISGNIHIFTVAKIGTLSDGK